MVYKTRKQGTVGFYNKQSYTFANKAVHSKTELSICMGQIKKSIQRQSCQYAWVGGCTCKRKEEPTT